MFQHIAKFYNSQVDRYSSRDPHIAMRRGPYLHPSSFIEGALRMASEDPESTALR